MMIDITWRCNEGCTHCMVDATPDGPDMDDETWLQVLDFVKHVRPQVVMVSGGEPTLHPRCLDWCRALLDAGCFVVLTSNGSFIDHMRIAHELQALNAEYEGLFLVQVTCDPRFYPNAEERLPRLLEMGIEVEQRIREVIPAGRARKNHPEARKTSLSPKCSNLYLMARQLAEQGPVGLTEVVQALESHMKVCTPLIDPHGNILAGEMSMCHKLGHVSDTMQANTMASLLCGGPCDACGMMKNMAPRYRALLG